MQYAVIFFTAKALSTANNRHTRSQGPEFYMLLIMSRSGFSVDDKVKYYAGISPFGATA
jgi:hypothetical protein